MAVPKQETFIYQPITITVNGLKSFVDDLVEQNYYVDKLVPIGAPVATSYLIFCIKTES